MRLFQSFTAMLGGNEVREEETVALDNFAGAHLYRGFEVGSIPDERVELTALTAWVR